MIGYKKYGLLIINNGVGIWFLDLCEWIVFFMWKYVYFMNFGIFIIIGIDVFICKIEMK